MALLTEEQRDEIWSEAMESFSSLGNVVVATKQELKDCVESLDAWFDGHESAINGSIAQPMRDNLTTAQKSALVIAVLRKRYG